MAIAQRFVDEAAESQMVLVHWRSYLWVWDGSGWKPESNWWLEVKLWNWLKEAYVMVGHVVKGEVVLTAQRVAPDEKIVRNVLKAVTALLDLGDDEVMPVWLSEVEGEERMNPKMCVGFLDKVVDVETGISVDRDATWFDNGVMGVNWEPGAECPRWMKCLDEWGGGDPEWGKLLQRMMGYCVMPYREFHRGFLWVGKTRSGKSTILKVLQRLMGKSACLNLSMSDMAEVFGLDGLQHARVLAVPEVEQLGGRGDGGRVARLWKNVVGQDPVTINAKYQRQVRNVVCAAVPVMVSNKMPKIPDDGSGVSDKLVILPFKVSYLGREQFDLLEELEGEMDGIAQWVFQGAQELMMGRGEPEKLWPVIEGAAERVQEFRLQNHPFDQFLEDYFVREEKGFVTHTYLVDRWERWVKESGYSGQWVNPQMLSVMIANESGWQLERTRRGKEGDRGLKGLGVKRVREAGM